MENTKHLRVIDICSIIEHPKTISNRYYYSKGNFFLKEGVRYWTGMPISRLVKSDEMIENKIYLEGSEVYLNPFLEISLNSGKKYIQYFSNIPDMLKESIEIRKARTEWYTLK